MSAPTSSGKTGGRRPSLQVDDSNKNDMEDKPSNRLSRSSGAERRLSVTSLKARANLDTWLVENLPKLLGESAEIDFESHEQPLGILIFDKSEKSAEDLAGEVEKMFGAVGKDKAGWADFSATFAKMIQEVRESFQTARKESKCIAVDADGKEDTKA